MQILKAIGLLMEYPDEFLWQCKEEVLSMVRRDAPLLDDFAAAMLNAPLLDKQAEWCEVFDRGRATSLLLFEHVHAESRDRGQAMVDLLAQYEKAGLVLDCRELPDHLPLYLEYCRKPKPAKGCKTSRRFWPCWAGGSSSAIRRGTCCLTPC